jgi:hypothetical protein
MKATETLCVGREEAQAIRVECRAEPSAPAVRLEVWHEVGSQADEEAAALRACAERLACLRARVRSLRRLVEQAERCHEKALC